MSSIIENSHKLGDYYVVPNTEPPRQLIAIDIKGRYFFETSSGAIYYYTKEALERTFVKVDYNPELIKGD
jgi:hypothetical protein